MSQIGTEVKAMFTANPPRSLKSRGIAMKTIPEISTRAGVNTDVHESHLQREFDGSGSQSGIVKLASNDGDPNNSSPYQH